MLHDIDLNVVQNFTGAKKDLFNYLNNKQVTKKSKFGDDTWEFETKPNIDRVHFSKHSEKLNNPEIILFWKIFTYIVILKKNLKNKAQAVFVSKAKTLFYYLNTLTDYNSFSTENALEFIDILQQQDVSRLYKTHQLQILKYWIEINQTLPIYFRLPYDPLANINTNAIFGEENKNYKRGRKGKEDEDWSPLTIPQAMFLTRESIMWVEKYSDDILNVYDIWKDYAGSNPICKEYRAFGSLYTTKTGVTPTRNIKLAEIIFNTITEKPDQSHPFHTIWNAADNFSKNKINREELKQFVSQKVATNSLRSLYGACIVLILMSTGMRKSELFSLQRGCIDIDSNPEIPLIESEVTKTNTGITKLPISQVGVKAVQVLERLGKIITNEESGPLIVPVEVDRKNKNMHMNKVANYTSHAFKMLSILCETINYGTPPNPHAFRHTLAACVWERTDQSPVLLKMLYNHSSLSMTLHYLRSNPMIQQAQKELFTNKYLPLVREVIHSAQDDELAGKASEKVQGLIRYVQNDFQFQGKTEEELETAMEELFMTLIEQNQLRLFLTPFCVCMRSNTSSSKSPCMHIEDHGDTFYSKLPRTDLCVGSSCHDSLFISYHQESIHNCMTFYDESMDSIPDDLKSNIHFAKIAAHESTKYKKIEKQLSKKRKNSA